MALVALLKGVNVGGYRNFRPSVLARTLHHLDVVNIGAAGTFVVRKPVSRTALRLELTRRLPFDTEVMIFDGGDVLRLVSADPFKGQSSGPAIVWFVSVLAKRGPTRPGLPLNLPSTGEWGVKVLGCQDRFLFGLYRREMKAIALLGQLEKIFGAPVTTRNWSTILAIVQVLEKRTN